MVIIQKSGFLPHSNRNVSGWPFQVSWYTISLSSYGHSGPGLTTLHVAWKTIEDALASPFKLEGVLFSGITNNQCILCFGPIISNMMRNFGMVEKCLGGN